MAKTRWLLLLLVLSVVIPFAATSTAPALAAIGDIKDPTPIDIVGNGRGVAFDGGSTLYYTVYPDTDIHSMSTAGVAIGSVPVLDAAGAAIQCGALSWDSSTGALWCGTYNGTGQVFTVDPGTGAATLEFDTNVTIPGGIAQDSCYGGTPNEQFIDGLAFDPTDGTLWLSGDAATTIYHLSATGTVIATSTTPIHPDSGAPGCSTGITVAPGGFLELAMQTAADTGPFVIAKVPKADPTSIVVSFVALPDGGPGIEGLAFDGDTYAPRCVVWSNQFGDNGALTAWDVQCTRTIGYWKNHTAEEFLPVTLGDGTKDGVCRVVGNDEDVADILKAANSKDAAYMLRAQLLAAKLNLLMGDIPPDDVTAITPVVDAADALLAKNGCNPDTGKKGADRAEANDLAEALDAFNNKYSP